MKFLNARSAEGSNESMVAAVARLQNELASKGKMK
jgi:hypothetical protein